jgi:hypothetical protein
MVFIPPTPATISDGLGQLCPPEWESPKRAVLLALIGALQNKSLLRATPLRIILW